MKIIADTDVCIAAGQCAYVAPELFDQSEDDGTVVILKAEPDAANEAAAEEAVTLCPSGAIKLA